MPHSKFYTQQEIVGKFDRLSKDKKISILHSAIDYMAQYNGRSRILCIAMAMGYDNNEGDSKSYFKR